LRTRIAHITDPHLLASGERLMGLDVNARLEDVLTAAERLRPDAYFLTGDLCAHDPDPAVYRHLRPRLDRLSAPYFFAAGNHDDRAMLRTAFDLPGEGGESLHRRIGVEKRDFLILDSAPGEVDRRQMDWLRRQISEVPTADIVFHHPPTLLGVAFMDRNYPLRNRGELLGVLTADGRPRRVFCGHYHSVRTVGHRNLHIHLCPPTSFFIDPEVEDEFSMIERPAGFQMLEWTESGDFRLVVKETSG
jgi:Icc protein